MPSNEERGGGPHQGQPVFTDGEPISEAKAAMILVHGRGATPEDILYLAYELDQPGFAYLAPEAFGRTWYPYRFLEPLARNEPYLSSALQVLGDLMARLEDAGIPPKRTMLGGFSQGACLALEYAARNACQYGGLIGLSGGLIGPEGTTWDFPGSLDGTPVFLGCSDVDFHIPKERVEETSEALERLGANVTKRLYPNMGHTINQDEIDFVQGMMSQLRKGSV